MVGMEWRWLDACDFCDASEAFLAREAASSRSGCSVMGSRKWPMVGSYGVCWGAAAGCG